MAASGTADPSPLSRAGLAFAVLGGLVLCWPFAVFSGPLVFIDSGSYAEQGAAIFRWLARAVPALDPGSGGAGASPGTEVAGARLDTLAAQASEIRSLAYAAFSHGASATPLGPLGLAWAQGAMVLAMLWPLVAGAWTAAPRATAALLLAAATLTPLALLVSYLMPDIFGAVVVLYGALLLGPIGGAGPAGRVALVLIAAFAITSHYGNIPLAVVCIGAALGLLGLSGRCGWARLALGAAPLALALAVNLAGSVVATGGAGTSVTPLRMPILLARSIGDGPARWYLEAECPKRGYAVCEAFPDGLPESGHEVLWGERGLSTRDRAFLDRVRAEEPEILVNAFLRYPLSQGWSLAGNALRQFARVDLRDMDTARPAPSRDVEGLTILVAERTIPGSAALGALYLASYGAGLLGLVLLVLLRRHGPGRLARDAAVVVLIGLAANALIFGGLSAPANRYQTRVAWLAPLLAGLLWLWPRPRGGAQPGG